MVLPEFQHKTTKAGFPCQAENCQNFKSVGGEQEVCGLISHPDAPSAQIQALPNNCGRMRNVKPEPCGVLRPANSTRRHFEVQDFTPLAFGMDFDRTAADFAIRREPLVRHARVNDHLGGLAAERTLDGLKNFHTRNLIASAQSATAHCSAFYDLPPPPDSEIVSVRFYGHL